MLAEIDKINAKIDLLLAGQGQSVVTENPERLKDIGETPGNEEISAEDLDKLFGK